MRPAAALALLLLTACASQRAPLVVASDLDNAPFAFVDDDGEPAGRDVEMMDTLASRLGRELEWERMPFEELLDAAAQARVDLVCATLGITPERRRLVDFSRPYFDTSIAVVVRDGPGEPRSLAALSGRRVSAAQGTTSERAVRAGLPGAELHLLPPGAHSAVEQLLAFEVDAAVMDAPDATRLVAEHAGELARLDDLESERYALALPRGSTLRPLLDGLLGEMSANGELAELDREWGLEPVQTP